MRNARWLVLTTVVSVLVVPRVCHAENWTGLAFLIVDTFYVLVALVILLPLHLILGAFDKPKRAARRASAARAMLVIGTITTVMALATSGFLIVSVWPALRSGGDFLVLVVAPAAPVLGTVTLITRSRKRLRAANAAPDGDA